MPIHAVLDAGIKIFDPVSANGLFGCTTFSIRLQFMKLGQLNPVTDWDRRYIVQREEVLDAYLFATLDEVRSLTRRWISSVQWGAPPSSAW